MSHLKAIQQDDQLVTQCAVNAVEVLNDHADKYLLLRSDRPSLQVWRVIQNPPQSRGQEKFDPDFTVATCKGQKVANAGGRCV